MNLSHTTASGLKRDKTFRGWLCYDGECRVCCACIKRFGGLLQRHGWDCEPLQTQWLRNRLDIRDGAPLTEVKLLMAGGEIFGGAEAILQIARSIWWAWPLFALAQVPGAKFFLRKTYESIAANRHCVGEACRAKGERRRRHGAFFEFP